jgi:sulfite exporter TauE/SafE
MRDVIIEPLLAGLSTGLFCCATCVPFLAPYLAAEQRGGRALFRVMLEFIGGRLAGYVLFGTAIGLIGEWADNAIFNRVSTVSMILLAAVMVLYAAGLLRPTSTLCAHTGLLRSRTPLVLGFLMGVNVCPPFLLSITYVFTLHSALKGAVYFLVFFAATTLYFLPLFFLGLLGKMKEFRAVARVSALLVGLLFLVYGVYAFARGEPVVHAP